MNNLTKRFANPSAIMALGVSLFAVSSHQVGAVNYGPETYCESEKCLVCEESTGEFVYVDRLADDTCPMYASFSWGMKLGGATHKTMPRLVDLPRIGAIEGVNRGNMRTFDDFSKRYTSVDALGLQDVLFEIDVAKITADVLDPAILKLHSDAEFTRIEDQGFINQVITENGFTHVDKLADGFRVRLWNKSEVSLVKSGKLYIVPTTVNPVQDVIFKSVPNVNDPGQFLTVSKESFGSVGTRTITRHHHRDDTNDTLTVTTHLGEDTTGTVLHRQELQYSNRGAKTWDYTIERKVYKASIDAAGVYGALTKVNHVKEVYQDFSTSAQGGDRGARRMISKVKDFGGENLTTTYSYHFDEQNRYIHGRVKSVENPDGSWTRSEYTDSEGAPTSVSKEYSSWKDVSIANYTEGRLVETALSADEMTRTTSIAGVQTAKEKLTTSTDSLGNFIVTESSWNGTEWANRVTCKYPENGDPLTAGRPMWRENADGTAEAYEYSSTNGQLTLIHKVGAGDRSGVTAGTITTTTLNASFQPVEKTVIDIESGHTLSQKVADISYGIDNFGRPQKWVYNNNPSDYSIEQYGCCGLEFSRSRTGATTTYSRDALKRVYRTVSKRSSTGTEVIQSTAYSGLTNSTTRTAGSTSLLVSEISRSLSGLTVTSKSPDADGDGNPEISTRVTTLNPASGSVTTNTAPNGATTITASFIDGKTKSVSGTAVTNSGSMTYDYGTHSLNGGGTYAQVTQANGTQSTKAYRDQLGRGFRSENADGLYSETTYHAQTAVAGSRGKVATVKDADEVANAASGSHVSYTYNARGERVSTTTKLSNGQQMVTTTEHDDVNDPDTGISHRYRTWVNGVLTNTTLRSGDGYKSKSITLAGTSSSERSVPVDGAWTVTSTAANGAFSIQTYTDGLLKKSATYPAGATNLNTEHLTLNTQTHDAFGRTLTSSDARTGTVTYGTYNENGSIQSMTDAGNRTTTYTYDNMGRTIAVDAPNTTDKDGNTIDNITHTSYNLTGTVAGTWGDQTYARFNVYDAQNRLVELRTYQDLAHGTEPTSTTTGFAKTNWNYDSQRGWLNNKRYDDNKGTDYTYTPAGRLKTRTWSRGITTTYGYDQGQMVSTNYSDSTQGVVYSYDNFGRPTLVTQGTGSTANQHAYLYDAVSLVLDKETISYGNGLSRTLDRSQDNLLRPAGFQLMNGTTEEHATSYGYDAAGRLAGVHTAAVYSATPDFAYNYLLNSGSLVESVNGPAHTVTNIYETNRNVLDTKSNETNGANVTLVSAFDYSVNDLGQRDDVSRSGSAFASANTETWNYNAKGEVVTADHDTNELFDRAYTFDGIGNRLTSETKQDTSAEGDAAEWDSVTKSYTSNALNQYSVAGGATRTFDDDGNLIDDATKRYTWDAENRLIKVESYEVDADEVKTYTEIATYAYDAYSRRITKTVGSTVTNFVYDGWNPIAEFSGTTLDKSYTWGMDVSGSIQGAGGVGGLLAEAEGSSTHYPIYDGNGNVSEYVDSTGAVVAHYEYDAFGQATPSTTNTKSFTHLFSTKQLDTETGLHYYGYRYYSSKVGQWLSRDPLGDYSFRAKYIEKLVNKKAEKITELISVSLDDVERRSGIIADIKSINSEINTFLSVEYSNLYQFVGGNPISRHDQFGLIAPLILAERAASAIGGCICGLIGEKAIQLGRAVGYAMCTNRTPAHHTLKVGNYVPPSVETCIAGALAGAAGPPGTGAAAGLLATAGFPAGVVAGCAQAQWEDLWD